MTTSAKHNAYRDDKIYVCKEMCSTCVFRPGNKMQLQSGRLRNMIEKAEAMQSAIICHSTLDGDNAVCKGFLDRHKTQPLQLAERLGMFEEIDPPCITE